MSSVRVKETWMIVDENYRSPTWADCYAVGTADMVFPEETEPSVPAAESETKEVPSSKSHTRMQAQRSRGAKEPRSYRAPGAAGSGCMCSCCQRGCQPREYMSKESLRGRYRERRFVERRYWPRVTSGVHLPVVIQPTRWYQVVGGMQCCHCKTQGRYQITSWMCQCCKVALCLKPYRNCYAQWHGERF
ncbi:hypothetical protein ILYODFUR_018684 [Ilyodon furcidens]|uniref:Uncharacterized protein n=1 Tax=Ilyodon furcidens TaxID=33524 RepID=A0ABV0V4T8_9TELE